jgi:hypothetical protein
MFYILFPRTDNLAPHLRQDQIKPWSNLQNTMQRQYHLGILFGITGYIVMVYGLKLGSKSTIETTHHNSSDIRVQSLLDESRELNKLFEPLEPNHIHMRIFRSPPITPRYV